MSLTAAACCIVWSASWFWRARLLVVKSSCRKESAQLVVVIGHLLIANGYDYIALANPVRAALGRIHLALEDGINLGLLKNEESDTATDLAR